MEEIWKDIAGYEGRYQISNYGRVLSVQRKENSWHGPATRTIPQRILKQSENRDGYFIIVLRNNGKKKTFRTNRLVAEAFIPNPNKLPCVNHKDENRKNNLADNLEWCTPQYNDLYGNRNKKLSLVNCKQVGQYSKNEELIRIWKSAKEANKAGFTSQNIAKCCKGKRKTCGGYVWKYI